MKEKRQNRSIFLRGMVLVMAFALMVLCLPFNGLVALAQMAEYTDYSFMTIGRTGEEFSTTVAKGKEYVIPNAYIGGYKQGGTNFVVGKNTSGVLGTIDSVPEEDVTLKSSTVTVSYSSLKLDEYTGEVTDETDITDKVVVTAEADNYGYFVADKVGTYTITYSYQYKIGSDEYTNSYELKVQSEVTNASVNFVDNEKNFLPSVVDLSQAKVGNSYKNMNLPCPDIKDEDGEILEDLTYVTSKDDIADEGNFVLVTAKGGINSKKITLSGEGKNLYIEGSVFENESYGAGKYTVTYAYYADGQFITSTTKSTQVYAKDYYTGGYNLKLELASDWNKTAQTGVESTLPKAIGVTTGDTKPANESVDVYYTVKVYYKKTNSSEGYKALSTEEIARYNEEAGETVINADGTLVDATKFKPLDDGSYSFVYDIYDYYYVEGSTNANDHHKWTSVGSYDWENIKDETAPTPVVYDASDIKDGKPTYKNVSTNLKSRASANSVVVYAIGINDNVSKNGDEGVELTRKIMTDETVTKLTIADYDEYNLVFNYRKDSQEAYSNLLYNNYLINKAVVKSGATIDSDASMLEWLKNNGYRIVVDNNNAEHIASLFTDFVTAEQSAKLDELNNAYKDATTANKADALKTRNAYVKEVFGTADALESGFAYVDVDQTFGATTTDGGMGIGTYYIHYVAKDAAGNEKDFSQSMYITSSLVDNEIPTIKFPTNLADSYLPTATVTFDAPSPSDNSDNYMQERVMYRYLDAEKKVVEVKDGDKVLSNVDLTELWADLGTTEEGTRGSDGKLLTEKYKDYHKDITSTYTTDGYIEITDADASSYSINLKEGTDKATYLQIVTFVYDDAGNANIYGETINILNVVDNIAPIFKKLDTENEFVKDYEQGAEIELPSFTVTDDAIDFMDYEINVYYVNGETKTKISTYDFSTSRKVLNSKGEGTYTVNAGKFVAPFAGRYEASIAIKDFKNNTIVSFVSYDVAGRNIVQPPVIKTSLENKTIELGETVELPTPSISYDIPNSMVYDEFVENGADAETKFIVRGVDANGKAPNYDVTFGQKGSFTPKTTGEYPITYSVDLEVYNHNIFKYVEMDLTNNIEGGYYKLTGSDENIQINKVGDKFVATTAEGTFDVVKEDDGVHVYKHNETIDASVMSGVLTDVDALANWFGNLNVYNLVSDTYTIIVNDTTGPVLNGGNKYDYEPTLDTDTTKLTIYGIQASDVSGELDEENSKITISAKLANSNPGDHEYKGAKAFQNNEFTLYNDNGKVLDGVYTITYKVYDKKGNVTTDVYTISVGDTEEPTLTFDEDFVEESYEIGSKLKIDRRLIHWDDHGREFPEGTTPTIKLVNTATNKEVAYEIVGDYYEFEEFTQVGTYKLTIEVEDAVGHKSTHPGFTIEVSEKSTDPVMTYKVVGIILIVISVLVLVGVIVYFIVSKVKLDKELKK